MTTISITETVEVISNTALSPEHYRITLGWIPLEARPGQFVMLKISPTMDPLLRRPFAIYNIHDEGVEILYRVVGRGTTLLSMLKKGDRVGVLGPLGNGFELPEDKETIMVAGGMGIVPFYMVAKELLKMDKTPQLVYGVRKEEELILADDIIGLGTEAQLVVEEKDNRVPTDILKEMAMDDRIVLACGPAGMLEKVASICESRGAECMVSVETSMACGMGVCMGCAMKTTWSYRMVCTDGPVFDVKELGWKS